MISFEALRHWTGTEQSPLYLEVSQYHAQFSRSFFFLNYKILVKYELFGFFSNCGTIEYLNKPFKIILPEGAVIPLTESGTTWYQ